MAFESDLQARILMLQRKLMLARIQLRQEWPSYELDQLMVDIDFLEAKLAFLQREESVVL